MPSINVELTKEEFETLKNCKPDTFSWKRFMLSSCWIMGRRSGKRRQEWGKNWNFDPPVKITKPCHDYGFCPYGQVVEIFPFSEPRGECSCKVFGHDCPAFWLAEPLSETPASV